MLTWVGKRTLDKVTAYPAQKIEAFNVTSSLLGEGWGQGNTWQDWPDKFDKGGLLFHGDNKDVLAHLLANGFRGKVKLIYIDPPFDSGADYVRKVQLRGQNGSTKIEGEEYTLGEQVQYTDIWANDNYLQFMYERLQLARELLSDDGYLFLHLDYRRSHYLKIIMDEIFGEENLKNEIIWHYGQRTAKREKRFDSKHDSILLYAKSDQARLNKTTVEWSYDEFISNRHDVMKDENGEEYILTDGGTGNGRYRRYVKDVLEEGKPLDSVWDLPLLNSSDNQRLGYPTQKPDYLLARIIDSGSFKNDIVLDFFSGSGTTVSVAQKLGRRWIGCDINKGAIQTTAKRLQNVMREQAQALDKQKQGKLIEDEKEAVLPAQLAFSSWRVNDYDLQIQHNEAVALACEHIGITRTRSDSFFDGRLGNRLVKIIPFNHPLTPLDLEDIDKELQRRPEEQRDVTVVCLGMELAARAWVEQHNRNRPINRYHIIELRTDGKYGGFIKHEPLIASIAINRDGEQLDIEVTDVFSPTIMQRLNMEEGLFRAHIDDWRAVVDCIMIDTDYNGDVFKVALSDIPAKKTELVSGHYQLPVPDKQDAVVAVKIIDMLGEEIIVTTQL